MHKPRVSSEENMIAVLECVAMYVEDSESPALCELIAERTGVHLDPSHPVFEGVDSALDDIEEQLR